MKVIFNISSILILITSSLLTSCAPSITRQQAEEELIAFMLDFYTRDSDGRSVKYVESSGEPWLNPPPEATLIVYALPNKKGNKEPWEQLSDDPIKVWWYFDNSLIEATDKQKAIQKYVEYYEYNSYDWDSYEFGILSISKNNTKAKVYTGGSSCPECAGGSILTLERNDSGRWKITDSELLWLS